jgi:hypothetical protein
MRFVVSVWNEFANDVEFENTIPLAFNGRRLAQLGERNQIDVLVLEGYRRFSDDYLGRLRELGYTVHDARALAQEHAAKIPLFVKKYRHWGGIKHFGLLRFLVISRFFPGEDIISVDADMVFNAGLGEMEAAVGGDLYFLERSTCLGSIPAKSGFFETFEEHLLRAHADPDGYARKVMRLRSADDFLDPNRFLGTDQAFLRHLHNSGIIDFRHDHMLGDNLIAFNTWLDIQQLGLGPYVYKRKNGVDYLNDRKVLVSHFSHDTWVYFWQPMLLSKLFGRENLAAFGRIPHLYPHIEQAAQNNLAFKHFLVAVHETFRRYSAAIPAGLNHFSRGAVIQHYYVESDLSEILNEQLWHTPGVFADSARGQGRHAGTSDAHDFTLGSGDPGRI